MGCIVGMSEGEIDPILVSKTKDNTYNLVDGYHRIEAAKQLGFEDIKAKVEEIPESQLLLKAYLANAKHGQPLTKEERDSTIRKMAIQGWKQEEIAKAIGISQGRIAQIVSSININITHKTKLRPADRYIVLKRWVNGETQEIIGKDFNVDHSTISNVCGELTKEITGKYKGGKHKWEVAEEYALSTNEIDKVLSKDGDPLNFKLPGDTWWPAFGLDSNQTKYPAACPLTLVKAILALFTKPENHIIDLMAGSGTVGLACRSFVRCASAAHKAGH